MPSVSNAGGSLTSAIVLTLLAWGVRWVRGELMRRKRDDVARQQESRSPGKFHAALSPTALRMLVETGPYPHIVFDVRPLTDADPLPTELRGSLRLPFDFVSQALSSPNAWKELFHGVPFPESHYMLVFVGATQEQQAKAAAAAAGQHFSRTMTLDGELAGFSWGAAAQPHLTYVSRDAVAALLCAPMGNGSSAMGRGGGGYGAVAAGVVIDVRRSDERALYGSIKGTVHIPVDRLPSALALDPDQFASQYGFAKPCPDELVVMSCRTNTRAAWAAQLAHDAGLPRCAVFREGAYGWRLDPSVKVYNGFKLFDPPPEPEPFEVEHAEVDAGMAELASLGVMVSMGTPPPPQYQSLP